MSQLPPVDNAELNRDDILSELGKEDEEKPLDIKDVEDTDSGDEDEEKPEETEEEELEVKDEEETEEDEEFSVPVPWKQIAKDYPDLFKKYPVLKVAYHRDKQFTELLGTVDDAREVVDKAQTLDNFEQKLMGGDTTSILSAVKESDPEAFNKLVDNYLPALQKVDERAYYHVVENIGKSIIVHIANEARRLGKENGEPLEQTALILNQFLFGSTEFSAPKKLAKEDDKKEDTEQQQYIRERFEDSRDDLNTRVSNQIKSTIAAHIDPKEHMTEYVRRNAINDALQITHKAVQTDPVFRKQLDKLWKNAFDNRFKRESLERIRSAYLSKAKSILPQAIKKARNEAMRGLGQKSSSRTDRRGPMPIGKSTSSSSKSGGQTTIPKGMTTLEYLNQD